MPAVSDHIRRDAEHAARSRIRVQLHKYLRRMDQDAKAEIAKAIAAADATGEPVDGTAIGEAAAAWAISVYMAEGVPEPAIDGNVQDELPPPA